MARYFLNPFADVGDRTPIPNDIDPGGSVSYASGWGFDYQRRLGTTPLAKPVPRGSTNQLMYDITSNIQQYQQLGFPEFITTADNGGTAFPYAKDAVVRYDAGAGYNVYVSLVDANDQLPTNALTWGILNLSLSSEFVGFMSYFAAALVGPPPPGWLVCDESAISRTTYATLFARIGVTWGIGDGSTTFNLPPSSRRVLVGSGGIGTPILGSDPGNLGGSETHALTANENGPHQHTYERFTTVAGATYQSGAGSAPDAITPATDSSGLGTPHTIMQPSMVGLLCIRYR